MNEVDCQDEEPRPPPTVMRYAIWFSIGDDGLEAFEDLFESGVEKWGYWPTLLWGVYQCFRTLGWAFWAAVAKAAGLF